MRNNPSGDDIATTSAVDTCPVCAAPFVRVRRQRYCSDSCRRTAWRRRHAAVQPDPLPIPATRPRRDTTVYECDECQMRYLGQQWCADCVRPCRRIGIGGLCPHCDEPVAIPDLLEAAEHPTSAEVITMPDR